MKNLLLKYLLIIITFSFSLFIIDCKKDKTSIPDIQTSEVSNISDTVAYCGGNITNEGTSEIIVHGVCWSTKTNPTIIDYKTSDGKGIGTYISKISGLKGGTTYHIRAYATNDVGTAYGSDISFTTNIGVPIIKTLETKNITLVSASSGGTIISDGGAFVTERGICWSTKQNPTITDNRTTYDESENNFICSLNSLCANTYYVRAYALNSVGIGYGNTVTFSTLTVKDFDDNLYHAVTIGNQIWLLENLHVTHYLNGDPITNETNVLSWVNFTIGAYCWYDNNKSAYHTENYGQLYNYYVINDNRNICPSGWHIPSKDEWDTLINYLGGTNSAGGKMKELGKTHWNESNSNVDNSSGFTALPAGEIGLMMSGGSTYLRFLGQGSYAYWWSSTIFPNSSNKLAYYSIVGGFDNTASSTNIAYLYQGLSIRCIKD